MAEQPSAEKDLLKIIENPKDIDAHKRKDADISAPAKIIRSDPEPKSVSKKFSVFDVKNLLLNRKNIIRLLAVITAGVFVFFIFTTVQEYNNLKKAKNLDAFTLIVNGQEQKTSRAEASSGGFLNSIEDTGASLRNIFRPGASKTEESKKESAASPLADFKLVGISVASSPSDSYAMIENTRTKITFFLKKGEKLEGMELLEIFEDKLSLKAQGEIVELR